AVEAFPVGAAVPGGSAVVDVDDADPAAGEVGLVQVEPGGGSSGGAAVHPDDVGGGPFPFHFGVGGRVDVGVHGGAVAAGQGHGTGFGQVPDGGGFGERAAEHGRRPVLRVEPHETGRLGGGGGDTDHGFPVTGQGVPACERR